MKIDSNLRLAIKSAFKAQPDDTWEDRKKRRKVAIAEMVAKDPKRVLRVTRAMAAIKKARDVIAENQKVFTELGVNEEMDNIESEAKYKAAGGKLPPACTRWNCDDILTKVAAADPEQGIKILERVGIRWK